MEQNSVSKEVSVIIVYPFEIIMKGIVLLLQQYGFQVPLMVDSLESLLKKSGDLHADLILINYRQYESGGTIKQIIDQTGVNVVLLGSSYSYHEDSYNKMLEQITEGITGFLDMDESLDIFLSELKDIAAGDIVVSKKFVKNLSQKAIIVKDKLDEMLSNREIGILDLLSTGNTNKEIGKELFISEHTVKVHLRNILTKLNLKNRQQAIAYAVRKSLLTEQHNREKY